MTWARPRYTYHNGGQLNERQLERKILVQVLDKVQPKLNQLLQQIPRPDSSDRSLISSSSRSNRDSERSSRASLDTPQAPSRRTDTDSRTGCTPDVHLYSSNCGSLLDMGVPEMERLQSVYRQDYNPYLQRHNAELEARRKKEKEREIDERWKRNVVAELAREVSNCRLGGDDQSHSCNANDSNSQKEKPSKCDAKVGTSPRPWVPPGQAVKSASDIERIVLCYNLPDRQQRPPPKTRSNQQRPADAYSRRPAFKVVPGRMSRKNLPSKKHRLPMEPIYPVEYAATFSPTRAAFRCPPARKMATINRGKKIEKIQRTSHDKASPPRTSPPMDTLTVPSKQKVYSSPRALSPSSTARSSREERTWSHKNSLLKETGTSTSIHTEGTTPYHSPSSETGKIRGILKKLG